MSDDKRAAFDAIDTNGDGFITAEEFKAALKTAVRGKVSDEHAATIVEMADKDGDRKINFDEYSQFVR
ncbi:EF-hand domain-containing protein [Streptomyces sp. NPDC126514]|uniref:EF-hand domain-containing protein n=1 Tax=Streptomyces sp. NPDC126514 TaxID=3155210 RepID=UPI00332E7259